MKILITGAAGFIGSQLAHRLWKNGDDLVLIDNFSFGHEDNLTFDDHDFRKEVLRMDIRDKDGIKSLMEKGDVDYIYNQLRRDLGKTYTMAYDIIKYLNSKGKNISAV